MGSEDYHYTFTSIYKGKDLHAFAPNTLLFDGQEMDIFGIHLKFFKGKGHSACGLITIVNDEFVHVGDLLMADQANRAILPLVGKNMIQEHIAALYQITKYTNHTILLSHGEPITGEENIYYQSHQRIHYLESLVNGHPEMTAEEALTKCDLEFSNIHWHKYNLRNR